MKCLSKTERKNACFVMNVAMATLREYKQILADCGHNLTIFDEFFLVETKTNEFIVTCKQCWLNYYRKPFF